MVVGSHFLRPEESLVFKSSTDGEYNQSRWIKRFEQLFANSRDMVNLFSLTQRKILCWNPRAGEAMGYSKEEMLALSLEEIYPESEQEKLFAALQRLVRDGFSEEKLLIYNSKREIRDIWIRSFVIQCDPEILCLTHTIDITEEKEREQQQLREARLAGLGESSAALAHEINNSLQAIQFNLYFIKDRLNNETASNVNRSIEKIEKNLEHIDAVIRNVTSYVHFAESEHSAVFLSSIIETTMQIIEGYLKAQNVALTVEIPKNLGPLFVNTNQVAQIMVILLKNACQAMINCAKKQLTIRGETQENGDLMLHVIDTGSGIAMEQKHVLFTSFSTSKAPGVGLGLGLSIAAKLAKCNNIALDVTSQLGNGSTFTLYFKTSQSLHHSHKILLYVDPHDGLCSSFCDTLKQRNFLVVKSRSARSALNVLRDNRIDIVVCTENLYPLSGAEFVNKAKLLYSGPIWLVPDSFSSVPQHIDKADSQVITLALPTTADDFYAELVQLV